MADREGCMYCGTTTAELRPYGKGGRPICFACMKKSPEREAEAEQRLGARLDACGPVAVIGSELGPQPLRGGGKA